MPAPRVSGILLHPTSLPGRQGIGDLGPAAHAWIEFLAAAGQRLWQVLPLNPTGYGDSPYQAFSAFAGNPILVSPEPLAEDGLLAPADLVSDRVFPDGRVDFGAVIPHKLALLDRAHANFCAGAAPALAGPFREFASAHAHWLEDFALFMALKETHGGAVWTEWSPALVRREPGALDEARDRLARAVDAQRFRQFLFFRQWLAVRARARESGIRLIGDIPIFVAHDSADVWAHQELFHLDGGGRPTHVAGVPPDYFSATGQLWGNPLYRWSAHRQSAYRWWIERFRATLETVDIARLDHFRGFEACWEIPAGAATAEKGRWVKGPGAPFFEALRGALGELPILAEDLGVVTPPVVALRDRFALPGMKVLQFAFGGDPTQGFLPHNLPHHCAIYTGTHDNDTTRGWYETASEAERDFARRYIGSDGGDIAWDLIRLALGSVADRALVPLQDVLDLGSEARMNHPGRPSGNWTWRVTAAALTPEVAARLRGLTEVYGRLAPPASEPQA